MKFQFRRAAKKTAFERAIENLQHPQETERMAAVGRILASVRVPGRRRTKQLERAVDGLLGVYEDNRAPETSSLAAFGLLAIAASGHEPFHSRIMQQMIKPESLFAAAEPEPVRRVAQAAYAL